MIEPICRAIAILALAGLAGAAAAQPQHSADQLKRDAQRHRAMAAAHEAAARCLESGNAYETCLKSLQSACKGLGIGKYCGMRHEH